MLKLIGEETSEKFFFNKFVDHIFRLLGRGDLYTNVRHLQGGYQELGGIG